MISSPRGTGTSPLVLLEAARGNPAALLAACRRLAATGDREISLRHLATRYATRDPETLAAAFLLAVDLLENGP